MKKNETELLTLDSLLKHHVNLLPKFKTNWNQHSLVTTSRQTISRVLYYDNLYKKIVGIPSVICEFGVQFGATLSQLIALRGIYEPYNYRRKIVGFDTFEGFVDVDGVYPSNGDYKVELGYEKKLSNFSYQKI